MTACNIQRKRESKEANIERTFYNVCSSSKKKSKCNLGRLHTFSGSGSLWGKSTTVDKFIPKTIKWVYAYVL